MAPSAKQAAPYKKAVPSKHRRPAANKGKHDLPVWQRILNNLAVMEARGQTNPKRHDIAAMCGYPKENGKGYTNALGMLKNQKKYVVVEKQTLAFTDLGREHAHPVATATSNEEQWEIAKDQIKSAKGKMIIDILSDGRAHSKQDIADALGVDVTSKGFTNLVSSLKGGDFIEYCDDAHGNKNKAIRMSKWLFPESSGTM